MYVYTVPYRVCVERSDKIKIYLRQRMRYILHLKAEEQVDPGISVQQLNTRGEIRREGGRELRVCALVQISIEPDLIVRVAPGSEKGGRGVIDQPVRTNVERHVNGTFISPAGHTT